MNVALPVRYKNTEYLVEFNEPDSTPDLKDYLVRVVSIKNKGIENFEMEDQIGKEFIFRNSDLDEKNVSLLDSKGHNILDILIKAYRNHISKDVSGIRRV